MSERDNVLEDYIKQILSASLTVIVTANGREYILPRSPKIIGLSAGIDFSNAIFYKCTIINNVSQFVPAHYDALRNQLGLEGAKQAIYYGPQRLTKEKLNEDPDRFFDFYTEPQTKFSNAPAYATVPAGLQLAGSGRSDELLREMTRLQVSEPQTLPWLSERGGLGVLLSMADIDFQNNHYAAAIDNYIKCLSIVYNSDTLWTKLEETLLRVRDQAGTMKEAFADLLSVAPLETQVWERKGGLAEKFGMDRTAAAFYGRAIEESAGTTRAVYKLNNLLLKIGRPRKIILPAPQPMPVQQFYAAPPPTPHPKPPYPPPPEKEMPPRTDDSAAEEGDKDTGSASEDEVFKCPNCGSAVSGTDTKCARCGVEFEEETEEAPPEDALEELRQNQEDIDNLAKELLGAAKNIGKLTTRYSFSYDKRCSYCGAFIGADAIKCKVCGEKKKHKK